MASKPAKRVKGKSAAAGSGTRCTACRSGWVEFKVVKQVPVRNASGSIVGYRDSTSVGNAKCGVCDGTGWR